MAVYACSDLHGMLHFYKAIKDILKPEDIVYFLGDAGDRGPHPWECIKTIMDAKKILVVVSGADKAEIVEKAFFGDITPQVPASILQLHEDVVVVVTHDGYIKRVSQRSYATNTEETKIGTAAKRIVL